MSGGLTAPIGRLVRHGTLLALAAVLVLGVAACQDPDDGPEPGDEPVAEPTDDRDDGQPDTAATPANPFSRMQLAAEHVGGDGTAHTLAGGIADGIGLDGDIDAPAVRTWTRLSTGLQEHVYLVGLTVDAAYSAGLDSDEFEFAADTLDRNSQEVAEVIGDTAGTDATELLDHWRDHVGSLIDYALAVEGGDEDGSRQALDDLEGFRAEAAEIVAALTDGELPTETVEQSLDGYLSAVVDAVDALAAGDTDAFDLLREAADRVSTDGTARIITEGILAAQELEGDLDARAAATYVALSTRLEEHVWLTGITVRTGFAEGLDSEVLAAAANTLDDNSVTLADTVGSVAGQDDRAAFLDLWRRHIEYLIDYARGAAGDDEQLQAAAFADLDGFRDELGAVVELVTTGELSAEDVSGSLADHITSVAEFIDAAAAMTR